MAGGNIGGFFVNLGMNIDKASFSAGEAALKGFESIAGKVTKALGITTGSMLTMAKAAGHMETAELKAARAIGVGASKLSEWKIAAGIAGTSGAALIGTMTQLEAKMQKIKLGQVDQNLAKNLGFLGLNYSDFSRMNSDERMRAVFNKADLMKDQQKAALLISETLGSGARDFYDYLKLSGKSLDQQLAEGRALNFTTEKSKQEALLFNKEINAVAQGAKSIATFMGSNIAAKLTPAATRIKEILISNRELIQSGIIGFTERLGNAVNGVIGFAAKIGPMVAGLIDRFGGLDKVIIKVGIGIGALRLSQTAGGIANIIKSVGMLKAALTGISTGLLAGGLFLVLEDLAVYFTGGDSLIGLIIDNMDALKEKFNIKIDASGFTELATALGSLIKNITHSDDVKSGLLKIGEGLAGLIINDLTNTINLLGKLAEIGADLASKNWSELGADIKDFFTLWAEGVLGLQNAQKAADDAYNKALNEGYSEKEAQNIAGAAKLRNMKIAGPMIHAGYWLGNAVGAIPDDFYNSLYPKDNARKTNDGILRPDGTLTQVAPDDWVFAVRNVEDLAAAFIPQGVSNTMNAPASYIINQNINVNGGNSTAAAVRQQAYNGANEAMLRSMNNSQRILQLMPGQR